MALVLAGSTAFGTLAVLAKLGYSAGVSLQQLLAYRFSLAAPALLLLALAARQNPFRLGARRLGGLLAMGAAGYSLQSLTFFAALRTLPASLVELVLYTYPAVVVVAGWLVFGRRPGRRHALALAVALAGVGLLVGARFQGGPGLALAAAAPLCYAAYLMAGERLMAGAPGLAAAAVVTSGSAVTWVALAAVSGHLAPPSGPRAWAVVGTIVLVPTMSAVVAILAALPRIGAARVSLIGTWEPVVTVSLAALVLGERPAALQLVGGCLVLAAVIWLEWPSRASRGAGET